jgi:hypothetical protein
MGWPTMVSGPKDRFAKAKRQQLRRKGRDYDEKKQLAEAEEMNAQGSYLCVACGGYAPLAMFQYEHDGKTKVARRCEACRRPWMGKERDREFSALDDPMDSTVYRVLVNQHRRRGEMAERRTARRNKARRERQGRKW